MKSLLVIIGQGPSQGQALLESLSAIMVLATYGVHVQVLLIDDAIGLLRPPHKSEDTAQINPFKSPHALVESFEFYDLLPVWVQPTSAEHHRRILDGTTIEYEVVQLNSDLLRSFEGVLRW